MVKYWYFAKLTGEIRILVLLYHHTYCKGDSMCDKPYVASLLSFILLTEERTMMKLKYAADVS